MLSSYIYIKFWIIPILLLPFHVKAENTNFQFIDFMKIGMDTRSLGMAGAATAVRGSATSACWNPSVLDTRKSFDFGIMYNNYMDSVKYQYGAFSSAITTNLAIAFSFYRIHFDNVKILVNDSLYSDSSKIINTIQDGLI